jgi:hypothetical protein
VPTLSAPGSYWYYAPNKVAPIVFTVLFGATGLWHFYQYAAGLFAPVAISNIDADVIASIAGEQLARYPGQVCSISVVSSPERSGRSTTPIWGWVLSLTCGRRIANRNCQDLHRQHRTPVRRAVRLVGPRRSIEADIMLQSHLRNSELLHIRKNPVLRYAHQAESRIFPMTHSTVPYHAPINPGRVGSTFTFLQLIVEGLTGE